MLPADYLASRASFLKLAASLGVAPRRFYLDGEGADSLSTDVAYIGSPAAPTLIVIASGTHGVEGYAGAMCQLHFMARWPQCKAGSDIAFLLVHAVNPWGYRHDRRVTQEGVDLNRNFIDFPLGPRAPSPYAAYHPLLVSQFRPLPAGLFNEARLMLSAITSHQRKAAQAAITAGQHDCPDGLFYGGAAPCKSRQIWQQIITEYASGRPRSVLLDIHTGLGRYGVGECISHLPATAPRFQQMAGWFHGNLKSMASGQSVSAALQGDLTAGFVRQLGPQASALGLEFGTTAPLAVLYALRFDQWSCNNAQQLPDRYRLAARRRMKQAFAPEDAAWCARVVARFDQVLAEIVAAMEDNAAGG